MSTKYIPLTEALAAHWSCPAFSYLPDALKVRVAKQLSEVAWIDLTPDGRRALAAQVDALHNQTLWNSEARIRELVKEVARLEEAAANLVGVDLDSVLRQRNEVIAEIELLAPPRDRRERLKARAAQLGGTRKAGVLNKLAAEEGVSRSMIKKLLGPARNG